MTIETAVVMTPLGPVTLYAKGGALVGLEFTDRAARRRALERRLRRHLGPFETREVHDPAGARGRLAAYFAGERNALSGQKVELHGTPFQLAVWRELRRIPPGRTLSYAALATRVARPRAVRAVGQANGNNPVSLFVPCHRVIAADGGLGGYGGGLQRKRRLLEHEGRTVA
jgi:methylated-DNA-[protein]-cysteine S-methyltransferase